MGLEWKREKKECGQEAFHRTTPKGKFGLSI